MYLKKLLTGLAGLILTVFFATTAFAEVKMAVVNVQKAVLDSEGAQVIIKQIQKELKSDEDRIRELEKVYAGMVERLTKDSEVMSDAEKRKLQQEIEIKQKDYAYESQKYQRSFEIRQQELFKGIDKKVQKAIEDLVKSDDYDLILHRQQVVYTADIYDITRKVTEKLNGMK